MERIKLSALAKRPFNMKHSIARRWAVNTLGLILIVLIAAEIAFSFAVKNFYYSAIKQTLVSKASTTSDLLVKYSGSDTTNFTQEVRSVVENFEQKDQMELMAIDHQGKITLTSSGFSYWFKTDLPDYQAALDSASGTGMFIGKLDSGEKVMAVTVLLPVDNAEYSALRFVVSLQQVDSMIFKSFLVFSLICLVIILFVVISGIYFLKSIVLPVQQLSAAAKKIAQGDYDTRIIKESNDELGQLCDTINQMAGELSASEKMKNEFISSVSHELRTPLTAIKGWGETLATSSAQDTQTIQKGMRVILHETERLSQMVEELLDFSRMQSGRFTLFKDRMDVLAELGEAVLIYTERARRENIELRYDEPIMLPPVYGDRNRIKQVFINIIDNAVKYTDPGGVVSVGAAEDGEGMIRIAVSDTGCGISPEDLPHVKEKFYKANLTRRGSGIGLAVAAEIIAMHDGDLTVDSVEGKGTTVIIRLPVLHKQDEADDQAGFERSGASEPEGKTAVQGSGPEQQL